MIAAAPSPETRLAARRAAYNAAGRCRCGRERAPGRRLCAACLASNRRACAKVRAFRARRQRCAWCKAALDRQGAYCRACCARRKAKRARPDCCSSCGVWTGGQPCQTCRAKRRGWQSERFALGEFWVDWSSARAIDDRQVGDPTPEEIAASAAEIRRGWSEERVRNEWAKTPGVVRLVSRILGRRR